MRVLFFDSIRPVICTVRIDVCTKRNLLSHTINGISYRIVSLFFLHVCQAIKLLTSFPLGSNLHTHTPWIYQLMNINISVEQKIDNLKWIKQEERKNIYTVICTLRAVQYYHLIKMWDIHCASREQCVNTLNNNKINYRVWCGVSCILVFGKWIYQLYFNWNQNLLHDPEHVTRVFSS